MNVHLARRLVVDREADRAHLDRRKTNRQFAGSRQAGEFGALAGLAQTDQITFRGRAVSYLGRSADEFGRATGRSASAFPAAARTRRRTGRKSASDSSQARP